MAKNKPNSGGGETKTPLIVALVFFVLATIIVGVLAYTFQGDIDAAKGEATTAKEESKTARDALSKEQDSRRLYQVVLGMGAEEDRAKLTASPNKDYLRDEHAKIVRNINARLQTAVEAERAGFVGGGTTFNPKIAELFKWDWPAQGDLLVAPTPGPLVEIIVKKWAERELAIQKFNNEKKTVATLETDLKAAKDAYDKEKGTLAAVTASYPRKLEDARAELAKDLKAKIDEFVVASKDYRGNIGKTKEELALQVQQREEIALKLRNIQEQLDKELTKQADKDDPFEFDKPKGTVTATFISQNIVEIDLGSADNVKAGLTFNIQPREVKDRGIQSRIKRVIEDGKYVERVVPKAKVEIIEVLGPNLSRARVTDVADPIRESILKGDLLYNAAWRKGSVDHIVLYGIFDIDGDGVDDIKTVDRAITKMGIIVDGYFDLSSRKWIRGGPTDRTAYAVEGAVPSASAGDGLIKEKGDLINSISLARDEAKKKGAKVVRYRDFFPRIGYAVKYDVNDDSINQAAAKYLRTNVAPEGEPK